MVKLNWASFKSFIQARSLPYTAIPHTDGYFVQSTDEITEVETFLLNPSSDYTDFVTNFLAGANTAASTRPRSVTGTVNLGTISTAATSTQQYQRPSQMNSRTHVEANVSGITANTVIRTITPGKTFYLTGFGVYGINESLSTAGNINISDDNTIKLPFLIPRDSGTSHPLVSTVGSMLEPLPFTNNITLKIVAGTITASVWIIGYEETN